MSTSTIQISLRPGQRIYLNGAVIRTDRKVTLELLNDATFLLESHVLQAHETNTPLRQLYFVVQTILIEPNGAERARKLFRQMHADVQASFNNPSINAGLAMVAIMVEGGRAFDALRLLRNLFPVEAAVLLASGTHAQAA